jgi:hypothetical protein
MPDSIIDGTGSSSHAKVSKLNRLYTSAVTQEKREEAVKNEDAYNINTGAITLTDANDTPVLYFKNNEERGVHVDLIVVGLGTSTGGDSTEMVEITIVRQPTAGTTISNANDVDINSNRNFGSTRTLTADAFKGATGETMTDGTDHIFAFQSDFGRLALDITEMIPRGSSLGIKIKPPTGNTSLKCYAAVICHIEPEE